MTDSGHTDTDTDTDTGEGHRPRATDGHAHARSAVEHLQQAAAEIISAAHAALDVLEEVVREPVDLGGFVARAVRLAQTVADRAWSGAAPTAGRESAGTGSGPGAGGQPVEHIPVS